MNQRISSASLTDAMPEPHTAAMKADREINTADLFPMARTIQRFETLMELVGM